MKRIGIPAIIVLSLAGYLTVQAQQKGPAQPAERKVTITESQLNKLVEHRIAQQRLKEQTSLDQEVLESKNWHTAIYEGVVYHVYTGPGDALAVTWAQRPQPADGSETESTTPAQTQPETPPTVRPQP